MSNTPRVLGGFPILALHPKSLRQIEGSWDFLKRTPEAYTNLSCGRFVFCWERGGDRSIGEANLRKGRSPFYGSGTAAPSMAGVPCAWLARLAPGVGAVIGSVFAGKFKICTKLYDFAFC